MLRSSHLQQHTNYLLLCPTRAERGFADAKNNHQVGHLGRRYVAALVVSGNMRILLGALNVSEFDGRKVVAEPKTGGGPRTSNRSDRSDRPDKKRGSGFKKRSFGGDSKKPGGRARVKAGSGGRRK